MSDVKQQILDEVQLESYPCDRSDSDVIQVGEVAIIINKHLEGMAIVPVEPTQHMIATGDIDSGASWPCAEDVYSAMLESFKEQS